jgi:S-DNA-T family DNA segregation ATPase FtsK/SpoIIIE
VEDLVQAFLPGASRETRLFINGRWATPDLTLDEIGLCEGTVIQCGQDVAAVPEGKVADLGVIAGPDSGLVIGLTPGDVTVGRGRDADVKLTDLTVSRPQARFSVSAVGDCSVADLQSLNGTLVDGALAQGTQKVDQSAVVRFCNTACVVRRPPPPDKPGDIDPLRHTTPSGTIPFNRPPRALAPAPKEPDLATPAPPAKRSTTPFNIAALVAPLVFGGVMVIVQHGQFQYALFALLSPVLFLGTWLEGKLRSRRESRVGSRNYASGLGTFEDRLKNRRMEEMRQRRVAVPDIVETLRRATTPSVLLWERRPADRDFLLLGVGVGTVPWSPPIRPESSSSGSSVEPDVLARWSTLAEVPINVSLASGGVVGIVGPRRTALDLARGLVCQAAIHHGPADLEVAVLIAPEAVEEWDWVKWLPHTIDRSSGGDTRLLAADPRIRDDLLKSLLQTRQSPKDARPGRPGGRDDKSTGPVLLLVLDDESLTKGRNSKARSILRGAAGPVAGIVIASSGDRLPSVCTSVIRLEDDDPLADVTTTGLGEHIANVNVAGLPSRVARPVARALARFDDPEVHDIGATLPDGVALLALLGWETPTPQAVGARWDTGGRIPALTAPIGVAESGTFTIDLVRDGPHALIAGTTGSGKSELLRSMVAGLAATCDPDHLTFVLIDYKGGTAFKACSQLPHTVGFVTDIDEQLGERALRCLEAELKYRERMLSEASASDLRDYLGRNLGPEHPTLPRLVVVIDEFATMAAELPDFMNSLVGIAQRGRALGVHLILATQRPSGAVNENIKANTNLRIALRVQDQQDSQDVIGTGDSAFIPSGHPGRGNIRLGPGEVIPVQTALSTGSSEAVELSPVEVVPFVFGRTSDGDRLPGRPPSVETAEDSRANDLTRLVEAIRTEAKLRKFARGRQPWPEPLKASIALEDVLPPERSRSDRIWFAMADYPDRQRQDPTGWSLAGNLVLYGIAGSGTTTALSSIALSAASCWSPDDLHIYALDFGAGDLAPLAGLPHTGKGGVVPASQRERQMRLVRYLHESLRQRKDLTAPERAALPKLICLVDNIRGFIGSFDESGGDELLLEFSRVWSEGTEIGIHMAVTADQIGALPSRLASLAEQKWLFRLADPQEYGNFGINPKQVPRPAPGRAILANSAQVVQVAWVGTDVARFVQSVAARQMKTPILPPRAIGVLPDRVSVAEIAGAARLDRWPWLLPIGIGDNTLVPVCLRLYEGEHATIAGPGRTGKTNALEVLAEVVRCRPDVRVLGVALGRSPLRESRGLDDLIGDQQSLDMLYDMVATTPSPHLILVDDADQIEDEEDVFGRLLALKRPDVHLVIAGRADALRTKYGHWTAKVRRSKVGLLLKPNVDNDGEVLDVELPKRHRVQMTVGRGYLADNGDLEVLQTAIHK